MASNTQKLHNQQLISSILDDYRIAIGDTNKTEGCYNALFSVFCAQVFQYLFDNDLAGQRINNSTDDAWVDTAQGTNEVQIGANKTAGDILTVYNGDTDYIARFLGDRFVDVFSLIVGTDLHQKIGNYHYIAVDYDYDSVNDLRFTASSGVLVVEECTVASATKEGGTWVEIWPTKLTEDYMPIGGSSDRPDEIAVVYTTTGKANLVSGQLTVINAAITTSSIVIYGVDGSGTSGAAITYTLSAGQCVFNSDSGTDTAEISYMII